MITTIRSELRDAISVPKERASLFFKTNKGDYAEGDVFIGVTVPNLRKIAKKFTKLTLPQLAELMQSQVNEERLLALIILVAQYQKGDKSRLYQFYLDNLAYVNNWNLVDASAHLIIGDYLWDKDRSSLLTLAHSATMWERRIAIVSTWHFIKKDDFEWTYKLAALLLNDTHDLIHKAVGWMLREAGKRNKALHIDFLNQHASTMPRTMLRYSIEKFPEPERQYYLNS